MGRLTEEYLGTYELSKVGVTDCWKICKGTNDCNKCVIQEAFNKLGHYEDLEEQGVLIEQKYGYWKGKPLGGYSTVRCSACSYVFTENTGRWKYCPNCGAKMEVRDE